MRFDGRDAAALAGLPAASTVPASAIPASAVPILLRKPSREALIQVFTSESPFVTSETIPKSNKYNFFW
jgi:hypothetical protein